MPYWCAAQLENNRVHLALNCLRLAGFDVYAPRLRTHRISHGRKIEGRPLLFPSYVFVAIIEAWYSARWCPGVIRLVMAGDTTPAKVPDAAIAAIRAQERNGAVELPRSPRFRRGDKVRIKFGPFQEHLALYDGQAAHERVAVLLQLLGGQTRTVLPADAIEPLS